MDKLCAVHVPRRPFRDGESLSVIGFGGLVAVGLEQSELDRLVAGSIDCGVNYFDVAPAYGEGEAEAKLGCALKTVRETVFLSSKTLHRTAAKAMNDLESSLRRLRTDRLDLYLCHAVRNLRDVEELLSPHGALETLASARRQGKIRFLGFSAHAAQPALELLDLGVFDSVSFPINFVCYARKNLGAQVLARAAERGTARIALKAMALTRWRKNEHRSFQNCWYKPIEDRDLARAALRFSLSENVTSVLPPGNERLYRLALDLIPDLTPMTVEERNRLFAMARTIQPILER